MWPFGIDLYGLHYYAERKVFWRRGWGRGGDCREKKEKGAETRRWLDNDWLTNKLTEYCASVRDTKKSTRRDDCVRLVKFLLLFNVHWPFAAQWSYMYRTVVTICTARLTFNNSTFCPHSCIYVFVWIWEQTAIISLYNLNWLVYITEI